MQPHGRISLIRGEVKDYCTALVSPSFLAIKDNPVELMLLVAKQVNDYHYIYLRAPNVSTVGSKTVAMFGSFGVVAM